MYSTIFLLLAIAISCVIQIATYKRVVQKIKDNEFSLSILLKKHDELEVLYSEKTNKSEINKELEVRVNVLEKENVDLRDEVSRLNEENDRLRKSQLDYNGSHLNHHKVVNHTELNNKDICFAKEIILLRDNLGMRETLLREYNEPLDSNAYKLISLTNKETLGILKRMSISVIDEVGKFNGELQSIRETKPTSDKSQHDTIAETFREGYRTKDKIIRPQEVVVYQYKQ